MRSIDSNYNPIWRIEFGSRLSPIGRIELHTYIYECLSCDGSVNWPHVSWTTPSPSPRKLGMVLFCFNLV